jgi:glyoxylase-like metal-dependent hydrolase (beta-lactamase superfamily II)
MLRVECTPVGRLLSNSYLLYDPEWGEGIIIDAGDDVEEIIRAVEMSDVEVRGIYLTHGHFDHVLAVRDLKEELGCGFYIHENDAMILSRVPLDAKYFLEVDVDQPPEPDGWVFDGQILRVGGHEVKVIHTPGHTPGSVCYLAGEVIFTGDTLFAGSIGRTDLPGGSLQDLLNSISVKILSLPDHYAVYPGHGPSSTIGVERRLNLFLRWIRDPQ